MTDQTLMERLNAVEGSDEGTLWYRNPDGPEAAQEIERLQERVERQESALIECLDILEHEKEGSTPAKFYDTAIRLARQALKDNSDDPL